MSKSSVIARVLSGDQLECQIVSPNGSLLTLSGRTSDAEPEVEGAETLRANQALINNAWAFAKFTYQKVNLPTEDEQDRAERRAESHQAVAAWIADLADDFARVTRRGWCSGCMTESDHRKVNGSLRHIPAYLCTNCGSPTLKCAAPKCDHMATRGKGAVRAPRYCAEHRHDIPSFAKVNGRYDLLEDYLEYLEYERPNLSRGTKIVGAGVAALVTGGALAIAAAPAIGGAVGTLVGGYSGAAAGSYGLALLGGGSIASGGLGMAGGTVVAAALGAGLGTAVGASVTNAYLREDKSFRIELLRGGTGVPVIVCNGFLSEKRTGWDEWRQIVTARYPDSPVYRVHWGARELADLGILTGYSAVKIAAPQAIKEAAASATKLGAKQLGPLGPVLFAAELAKNPWHVAKNRADKTGVVLSDLLARSRAESYVLIGHSLGARVAVVAAQALGSKPDGPRIEAVHLLGAAIGAESDWSGLTKRVNGAVYNYHSTRDAVLKYLYPIVMAGQGAAGARGFTPPTQLLKNVDVSDAVSGHSDYHTAVTLR